MIASAFLVITIVLTAASQIYQKQVALAFHAPENHETSLLKFYVISPRFWFALFLLGAAMISWLGVLAIMDVGKAYPLLSANYVVILLISRFIFAEQIPLTRWLGVFVICAALFLIAGS